MGIPTLEEILGKFNSPDQKRVWKAVRAGDTRKARSLQKLILRSQAARFLAIRQVTQLNNGKKTAGIDGKLALTFKEKFQLEEELRLKASNWEHKGLREIPIPKKDGTKRILKVPTISDRAWASLAKYALEPDSRCNISCTKLWIQTPDARRTMHRKSSS